MKKFAEQGISLVNPKYFQSVLRSSEIYKKNEDIRSEFSRDYNRILHCNAFRRLKHKTQVFYATENDHICTRIEHVQHVESVSRAICDELGLNTELAAAIALGHDLGHAPFGHEGEKIISKISMQYLNKMFWHEFNSLRVIDRIEGLLDLDGVEQPLNLTYAVRDGIISHCGEVDQNALRPRNEAIDLSSIKFPNEFAPYTWEGCVVKIADKIAYLGRDIEDAVRLGVIDKKQIDTLNQIVKNFDSVAESVFTTSLMHNFIINLCDNSCPENGLVFNSATFELMRSIKDFNYSNIYSHPRIKRYNNYVELIIVTVFEFYMDMYDKENTLSIIKSNSTQYPLSLQSFGDWVEKYSKNFNSKNNFGLFDISVKTDYIDSVLTYLSLMTDQYAMRLFGEITHF